jgi:DNA mismatch repair protein MutL
MGQIRILDQNMINMIAAGEVIERPASVVKELMENSIDAGATKITVAIEDGGRKSISITDDGCGMDAEDLAQAFEPHTTSKIKTSADLGRISTLGFRGEALASIASVAQVKAVSRTKNAIGANCMEIDCGSKSNVGPCSGDYGTTIHVRDLFYKLPARRKFLRTANTEMTHITEQFIRIALGSYFAVNPTAVSPADAPASSRKGLDLTLIHNDREIHRLLANQTLHQRITELFSSELAEKLIETEVNERGIHISGLFGRPDTSRTSGKFQYVFLNGRFIRDKFISHAIKEAYRSLIEQNRFPVIFLFIEMPYKDYDVNVHPTKIEVRFYNANLVHSQILGCLREKLLSTDLQPHAQLPIVAVPRTHRDRSTGTHRSQEITEAMAEFFKKHRPTDRQELSQVSTTKPTKAYSTTSAQTMAQQRTDTTVSIGPVETKFMQIHDSYLVQQIQDGFIIIDQHALHERILYEALCRRIKQNKPESQRLLIPDSFEITQAQQNIIDTNRPLIEKLGIELVPFGPKTYAVQAFPILLSRATPADFVRDLIDLLDDKATELDAEKLLDEVLKMAACKAAIKAGQKLNNAEIEQLLEDRKHTERASQCPHGRPTAIKFTLSDLEKQFKRT